MTTQILIVDDEPANLATLRQILSPEYALVFARSGHDALHMATKHRPDLILLDIQMPDMSGYEVCRELKKDVNTNGIPVIFITSLSEVGDEAAGFEVGAVDFILKPVTPLLVRARVRAHLSLVSAIQLERSYLEAISMLGVASEVKDIDTGVHIWRMASYSRALAAAIGYDEIQCKHIELAAPMHDVGKLGIPDIILRKPGALDPSERSIMQRHSEIGFKILSKSNAPILQMAAMIALHHHEKWDGSGYPRGLVGEAIPEVARIVAIADVFDALRMVRPYKAAWPLEQVIEALTNGAGKHFDPNLVRHFIGILPQILALEADWSRKEREDLYL
ncbi:response regulator [Chitinibacter bivalviorum]|uniref:Response regulator n=1 Tax=Chitinibacter bivalviorum TaxID=2739434 RepID=A0A7H9BH92_9NEIS|nr:HD domain-containing phosphohydrolase [Chitinibacter bivalviorum]QLG87578.1 response regulator [Chitinibacter bivalviorum]